MSKTTQLRHRITHLDQRGNGLIGSLVSLFFGIITGLVLLRFLFLLLGANAGNGLVDFVYQYSQPLVAPFVGIFNTNVDLTTTGQFDIASLVALLVYGLLATLVGRAFGSNYSHSH